MQKPPKKRGPKRKLRAFSEVPLGYQIRLKAPLEYDLIMQVVGFKRPPEADLIESVSYSSTNPFFKSQEFRDLLIIYRRDGCYTSNPKKPPTPAQIEKAAKQRRKVMMNAI